MAELILILTRLALIGSVLSEKKRLHYNQLSL